MKINLDPINNNLFLLLYSLQYIKQMEHIKMSIIVIIYKEKLIK